MVAEEATEAPVGDADWSFLPQEERIATAKRAESVSMRVMAVNKFLNG
jgi:hypothetical protein